MLVAVGFILSVEFSASVREDAPVAAMSNASDATRCPFERPRLARLSNRVRTWLHPSRYSSDASQRGRERIVQPRSFNIVTRRKIVKRSSSSSFDKASSGATRFYTRTRERKVIIAYLENTCEIAARYRE